MKKNRKKAETYRFNGHPWFDPGSIHSVTIADLESRIQDFEAKLADPIDPDDKKWTNGWLSRLRQELAKKRKGLELKGPERSKRCRTGRRM
jgi:hypothetical protein